MYIVGTRYGADSRANLTRCRRSSSEARSAIQTFSAACLVVLVVLSVDKILHREPTRELHDGERSQLDAPRSRRRWAQPAVRDELRTHVRTIS